jgi:hypothetical protein
MLDFTDKTTLAFATDAISMIIIKGIDSIRESLDLTSDAGKGPGRPQAFPGLECLIAEMERLALTFGGKGFGMPTTRPQKGRIIQILDRLRKYFIDDTGLSWLADFLPPPGKHPVSSYQRAIKQGRAEYAEELERSRNFGDTSENCEG